MFGRGNESDELPEVDEGDFEETIQEIEEVSRKRVVQGGAVVLEKKKRIEMPATRL
jgi:predicted nuclease of restriction endonuclease-like RecB superfamily